MAPYSWSRMIQASKLGESKLIQKYLICTPFKAEIFTKDAKLKVLVRKVCRSPETLNCFEKVTYTLCWSSKPLLTGCTLRLLA